MAADAVPFERIGPWYYSGFVEPTRLVIRDYAAWRAFWTQLEAMQSPKTRPPTVNFGRDVVIAVAMGTRGSGGYEIRIEQILESGGRLAVDVNEISPGSGCVVTQALTQPVDAVRIAAAGARDVQFLTRRTVQHCD